MCQALVGLGQDVQYNTAVAAVVTLTYSESVVLHNTTLQMKPTKECLPTHACALMHIYTVIFYTKLKCLIKYLTNTK